MWYEGFLEAKKLYVEVIERLVTLANVHVVYNPSNHDYQSGFFLADVIKSWFRLSENITFDTSISHRKYYRYGNNLIFESEDKFRIEQLISESWDFVKNKIQSFAHTELNNSAILEAIDVKAMMERGVGFNPQDPRPFVPVKLDNYFPGTLLEQQEKYKSFPYCKTWKGFVCKK